MSFPRECALDPAPPRAADARYVLGGYLAGLVAMSPTPLLYYWLFAPLGALLAAAACLLVALARPRFADVARGALLAAAFGAVTILVLFVTAAQH